MAHFAEIDNNNKVIRVVVACNQDIENNGGEQSTQAAEHFKTICKLSENGVRWVQTSYNKKFRKLYAGINCYYDDIKDKFIQNQPYPSWTLDSNDDWQPPVARPNTLNIENTTDKVVEPIIWNESTLTWNSSNKDNVQYYFDKNNNIWKLI